MKTAVLVCIHRWLVASPDGTEALPAKCRLCGAERTFSSQPKVSQWNRLPGKGAA